MHRVGLAPPVIASFRTHVATAAHSANKVVFTFSSSFSCHIPLCEVFVFCCSIMTRSVKIDHKMMEGNKIVKEYVQKHNGLYLIKGTRVSLDSIVYAWWAGQSAETITQSFQVLTLEQVYGAIAFYLAHEEEIDRYLEQRRADYEVKRQASRHTDPMFYQKMAAARRQLLITP